MTGRQRFSIIPAQAVTDQRLEPRDLQVLCLLGRHTDDLGWCCRSQVRMAKELSCGRATVQRALGRLVDAGYLEHRPKQRSSGADAAHDYRVVIDPPEAPAEADSDAEGVPTGGQGCPPMDGQGVPAHERAPMLTTPDKRTERERAGDGGEDGKQETASPDNRKAVHRDFEKAFREWPTSISDSRPEAWKAWLELSPEERGTAAAEAGRYVEACRAAGRKHVCSHGVYLREKRWTGLGPKADEKPAALDAKAFGPLWQAARMKQLLAGVQRVPAGLTATQRALVEMGKADEAELQREQQARSSWPTVNAMHERAEFGRGVSAAPSLEPLAALMEPVPVGSERFEEWKLEHRLRGWPWLPETGRQPVVYFPAGGPAAGLAAFDAAMRGEGGEAHTANEAAE